MGDTVIFYFIDFILAVSCSFKFHSGYLLIIGSLSSRLDVQYGDLIFPFGYHYWVSFIFLLCFLESVPVPSLLWLILSMSCCPHQLPLGGKHVAMCTSCCVAWIRCLVIQSSEIYWADIMCLALLVSKQFWQ